MKVLQSEQPLPTCIHGQCLMPMRRFSVQSDVYAYGMFLYEILTHHFPFEKFVTERPDGSLLSLSAQHWSQLDFHKKGNENILKRCVSKATANLCIPEEIERESPVGYVELLKKCISVRCVLHL